MYRIAYSSIAFLKWASQWSCILSLILCHIVKQVNHLRSAQSNRQFESCTQWQSHVLTSFKLWFAFCIKMIVLVNQVSPLAFQSASLKVSLLPDRASRSVQVMRFVTNFWYLQSASRPAKEEEGEDEHGSWRILQVPSSFLIHQESCPTGEPHTKIIIWSPVKKLLCCTSEKQGLQQIICERSFRPWLNVIKEPDSISLKKGSNQLC